MAQDVTGVTTQRGGGVGVDRGAECEEDFILILVEVAGDPSVATTN